MSEASQFLLFMILIGAVGLAVMVMSVKTCGALQSRSRSRLQLFATAVARSRFKAKQPIERQLGSRPDRP
jgi:hypothetical protein